MVRKVGRERKKRKDRIGYIVLICAAFIAVGLFSAFYYFKGQHVELDKECLCPKAGPCEISVVLVDQTDQFSPVQRASLAQHLKGITSEIPRYGLLELYAVGSTHKELLKPQFRLCNPGRGKEINSLVGNPARVEKRWREGFSVHLKKNLEDILTPSQSKTSPILESIQSVAVSAFGDPSLSTVPKRLIIISDMLHHTPELSQYNEITAFEKFRGTQYYLRARPNLKDVQVEIYYLRRSTRSHVQGKRHIEFWQSLVTDAGGALTRVVSIEG